MKKLGKSLLVVVAASLFGCASIELHPDNEPVQLVFSDVSLEDELESGCRYLGTLVSSYGNWYNYLFISNTDLTQGAINDMLNRANEVGANVVFVRNIDFATSVTLLGQAYDCKLP